MRSVILFVPVKHNPCAHFLPVSGNKNGTNFTVNPIPIQYAHSIIKSAKKAGFLLTAPFPSRRLKNLFLEQFENILFAACRLSPPDHLEALEKIRHTKALERKKKFLSRQVKSFVSLTRSPPWLIIAITSWEKTNKQWERESGRQHYYYFAQNFFSSVYNAIPSCVVVPTQKILESLLILCMIFTLLCDYVTYAWRPWW